MVWLHNSVNILKVTELYTLNGWILWYMNYSSIKLLKNVCDKKKKNGHPEPKIAILFLCWFPKMPEESCLLHFPKTNQRGEKSYSFNLCQGKEELGDKNFMNRTYNVQSTLITWGKWPYTHKSLEAKCLHPTCSYSLTFKGYNPTHRAAKVKTLITLEMWL